MAREKKEVAEKEVMEDTVMEDSIAEEVETDPWEKMVKIKLPRPQKGESTQEEYSVNGRVFLIKKGIEVEVPAPIAEVIKNRDDALDEAYDFNAETANEE